MSTPARTDFLPVAVRSAPRPARAAGQRDQRHGDHTLFWSFSLRGDRHDLAAARRVLRGLHRIRLRGALARCVTSPWAVTCQGGLTPEGPERPGRCVAGERSDRRQAPPNVGFLSPAVSTRRCRQVTATPPAKDPPICATWHRHLVEPDAGRRTLGAGVRLRPNRRVPARPAAGTTTAPRTRSPRKCGDRPVCDRAPTTTAAAPAPHRDPRGLSGSQGAPRVSVR